MTVRVEARRFGATPNGENVGAFTISNERGMRVEVIELGAILMRIVCPDRSGRPGNVVLGYDSPDDYLADTNYFGAVVGRYANRIARGRFQLDGKEYVLAINNPPNHLHGGACGYDKRVWRGSPLENGVALALSSPDGEEGYPGNLELTVRYELDDENRLSVRYTATTDAPTILNPSQHSYFNLAGDGREITGHVLVISADRYTPVDDTLIPTGELRGVADTAFDFRRAKTIGRDIDTADPQLQYGRGYDHNFVLSQTPDRDGLRHAATVIEPDYGRVLTVRTDQPGLQFYSGNFLPKRVAFCLETQRFPNSPNIPHFPSTVLRPGETFESRTVFGFSVT